MTILISHEGALGDVLLSLPAIRFLKKEGQLIHLAGRSDVAAFLRDAGAVDEASASDSGLYACLYSGDISERVRSFLNGFSCAVMFSVRPDPVFVGSVRSVIGDSRAIITIPPADVHVHVSEYRLSQIAADGTAGSGLLLDIPRKEQDRAIGMVSDAGYDRSLPLIVIHPGSGGKAKCWPLENYLDLVVRLQDSMGAFVVILAGPAEDGFCKDRIGAFSRGRPGVVAVVDAPLMDVAALVGQCDLFIGNDAGITHLAAVLCRSVLVLFGPTDPDRWRPIGPQVEVVRAPVLAELPVDVVYDRMAAILSKSFAALPGADASSPRTRRC